VPLKLVITWGDLDVCLGCVVRVKLTEQDSMMSLWTSLARGCDLGIPYERYLWQVYVRVEGPGVECLCGMKP
jgi:hypothetical protein